jgi:hypothetical protein
MAWTKKQLSPAEEEAKALRQRHASNTEIPYQEADPEQGEIPLDELDTFVIPARDDKGIGVPVTLHIPPYLERQIEIVVASRRFPYLRAADFIRHACVRHLAWLIGIRFSLPRHMHVTMNTISDILRDEEFKHQVEGAFHRMDRLVGDHVNRGDKIEAIRLYVRIRQRVMESTEGSWRERFLKQFDEKYSYLLAVERRVTELEVVSKTGAA